jgi:DNA polymerase-1
MNFPDAKKTKTGYKTDQETLEGYRLYSPIIDKILEYRALAKLKQTYIDGIKEVIFPDNKVHTIYCQALTETGRLSSISPNLQNIPARSGEGRNIRKFFIPSKGSSFFSADYSQIELRVLAHMADVKPLIDAFNKDMDIHSETARQIFDTSDITDDLRRKAKAVNFGIIYGLSAFGLAKEIGISNKEAQNFIDKYYKLYPGIKEFMDNTINFCKENGYVKTILNRIRRIPDINSKNYMVREYATRTAMNAPIQGSAADIIKIAMINIYNRFKRENIKSLMLMQIHDELIFEVKDNERDAVLKIVSEEMENAYKLKVKLSISKDFGSSLFEV